MPSLAQIVGLVAESVPDDWIYLDAVKDPRHVHRQEPEISVIITRFGNAAGREGWEGAVFWEAAICLNAIPIHLVRLLRAGRDVYCWPSYEEPVTETTRERRAGDLFATLILSHPLASSDEHVAADHPPVPVVEADRDSFSPVLDESGVDDGSQIVRVRLSSLAMEQINAHRTSTGASATQAIHDAIALQAAAPSTTPVSEPRQIRISPTRE